MHLKFINKEINKNLEKDNKNEENKNKLLLLLKGFDYNYAYQENTKRLTNAYIKRHIEIGQHIAKMDLGVVYSIINKYILNNTMLMQTRIALINIIFETSNMSYVPTETELEVTKIQNTLITYNPDLIFRNENEDYRMIGLCKQEKVSYRSKAQIRWCESYMKEINLQIDMEKIFEKNIKDVNKKTKQAIYNWLDSKFPSVVFDDEFSFFPVQKIVNEYKDTFLLFTDDEKEAISIYESYTDFYDPRWVSYMYNKHKKEEWQQILPYMN